MTTKKLIFVVISLLAVLFTGCDKTPVMPEVNDENCRFELIKKLDKSIQQEFSSKCFRRGEFKPSIPKSW